MSAIMPENRGIKEIKLANIPAFPAVVLRVLDIISQDDPDFDLLVREITSDATLAAQVLRLANSPLFGFEAQICTVQHAVAALGIANIQSLLMSVATANYSRAALKTEALQKCWRHTLATAILCREVARAAGVQAERAYSLGLLHDIGRLGLLVAWPDDYNLILKEADRDSVSLLDLEKRLFSMDHCEVGRLLVEQWKFPPEFRVIAGRHHDSPAGGADFDNLRIVHLGCELADSLGYWVAKPLHPKSIEELLSELPPAVRDCFQSDAETLKNLVERSVTGGEDALVQTPREYVPMRRATDDLEKYAAIPARLEENPRPKNLEIPAGFEVKSMAWDFTIVLASVLTFMCVLVLIYFVLRSS